MERTPNGMAKSSKIDWRLSEVSWVHTRIFSKASTHKVQVLLAVFKTALAVGALLMMVGVVPALASEELAKVMVRNIGLRELRVEYNQTHFSWRAEIHHNRRKILKICVWPELYDKDGFLLNNTILGSASKRFDIPPDTWESVSYSGSLDQSLFSQVKRYTVKARVARYIDSCPP